MYTIHVLYKMWDFLKTLQVHSAGSWEFAAFTVIAF